MGLRQTTVSHQPFSFGFNGNRVRDCVYSCELEMKSVELESVEELEREIVFVQSSEALKQKVLL